MLGFLIGLAVGAIVGGISGYAQEGVGGILKGVLSGAKDGALMGAAFGGLSGFGAGLGTIGQCSTAINTLFNVSGVISVGMQSFDMLALGDMTMMRLSKDLGFNYNGGQIAAANAKAHSNPFYNAVQMGTGMTAAFTGGYKSSAKCFIAGTLVLTANGIVAIEMIKAGDMVYAADAETLEVSLKPVLETYIRETSHLVHLTINGENIISTYDHPYYVKDKGFVSAEALWIGAELIDKNGNVVLVKQLYRENLGDESVKVYNFQVEDYHTYFVGLNTILVHNSNCRLIQNSDGSYDAELSYKEGWTPEQRAQADAKCKALSDAYTVKTNVAGKRNGTKTSRYRKDNAIPSNQDVDHTIDLQLGGQDNVINMNGLDKSVNRSLGKQINILIKNLHEGTVLGKFTMK